jgi:hypothetical protein
VFVCDPSADAERLLGALRARGYPVVDVPLGLLSSRLRYQIPRLVLCDADAPDALERVRELRAASGTRDVRVVFLGGDQGAIQRDPAFRVEGHGVFFRPLDLDKVCAHIESLIGLPNRDQRADAHSIAPRRAPVIVPSARKPYRSDEGPISSRPLDSGTGLGDTSFGSAPRASLIPASTSGEEEAAPELSGETRALLDRAHAAASAMTYQASRPTRLATDGEQPVDVDFEVLAALEVPLDEPLEALGESEVSGGTAGGLGSEIGSAPPGETEKPGRRPSAPITPRSYAAEGAVTNPGGRIASQPVPSRPWGSLPATAPPSLTGATVHNAGGPTELPDPLRAVRETVAPPRRPLEPAPSAHAEPGEESLGELDEFPSYREMTPMPEASLLLSDPPLQETPPPRPSARPPAGRRPSERPRGVSTVHGAAEGPAAERPAAERPAAERPAAESRAAEGAARREAREPSAQGRHRAVRLADLQRTPEAVLPGGATSALATAIRERASGALALQDTAGIRRVVLRDGDVVTAVSGIEGESLVRFLEVTGDLEPQTADQLARSLPAFGRHAGAGLIANGHLQQEDLWPVLRAHAEWILAAVVAMSSGRVSWEEEVPVRLQDEPAVFGGAAGCEVFVEAVRRTIEPAEAWHFLGGGDRTLGVGAHRGLLGECALEPELEDEVQELVDVPLEPLYRARPELMPILYALVELDVFTKGGGQRVRRPSVRPERGAERTGARNAASGPALTEDPLDDAAFEARLLARRALVDEGDYFSILGVKRSATDYELHRAREALHRQLSPERLTVRTAHLLEDVKLVLRIVDEAYGVLRDPIRRERYRRALEAKPD